MRARFLMARHVSPTSSGCRWQTTSLENGRRWERSSGAATDRGGREPLRGVQLAVGERRRFGDFLLVEWSADYGDGAIYRNVTLAEIEDGEAVRVTDYWGKPFDTPDWREEVTGRLDMPADGRWPSADRLSHH